MAKGGKKLQIKGAGTAAMGGAKTLGKKGAAKSGGMKKIGCK